MISPKALRLALVVVALASTIVAGAQPHPISPTGLTRLTGPISPISDHPTSCVSLSDRLTFYHEWPSGDEGAKKFLAIVPPAEQLEPEVLEAALERTSRGEASTTDTIGDLVRWLKDHPQERARIFLSQPIGYVRHYRIVELQVTPVLHNNNATYNIRRMRWTYRWKSSHWPPEGFRDEAARWSDHGFKAVLSRVVVNPDAVGLYADPNPPSGDLPLPLDGLTFKRLGDSKLPVARLDVSSGGLYRLDVGTVRSATSGTVSTLDHVQLYCSGQSIPLYLHRDTSRPDGPEELLFYGVASDSPYTRVNRYWLTEDRDLKPLRMAVAAVTPKWRSMPAEKTFPEALTIEQDNELVLHTDNFLTISEFRWVWGEIPPTDQPASATAMIRQGPGEKAWFTSATFSLPGMASQVGLLRIDVHFFYDSLSLSQTARYEVAINDAAPQSVSLHGPEDLMKTLGFEAGRLRESSNMISIRLAPGQSPPKESVYFDRLVVHYRRRFEAIEHGFTFSSDPPTSIGWRHYAVGGKLPDRLVVLDIADPGKPRVIEHERDAQGVVHFGQKEDRLALYRLLSLDRISTPTAAPTAYLDDVSSQPTPVDYLIISHRDFLDLLDPLVTVLKEAGLRVRVVDVENVYASFTWGLSGPVAIKAFLAHTLRHWPGGGPSYVLFVGDCTSDYRGDFRNEIRNFVPGYTYTRAPDEKWTSEHWFTTLCGTDDLSDVMLGRLSVNNRADARTVIEKIVRYRTKPVLDPWRARLTYVVDEGSTFENDAERLRQSLKPSALVGQRIFLSENPWEDNFYLPPEIVEEDKAKVSPVTTTRILDMFNRGSVFVIFNGHGSPNIWSNDRIWFGGGSPNSDILLMRNGDRLPFIVNFTCNSGAIDYPDPPWNLCISEDFMRCTSGGAIALFVPSGPGVPATHMRLAEHLQHALFYEDLRWLGDIVTLAGLRYVLKRNSPDMIRMYVYMGDPALPIQLPDQMFPLTVDRSIVSTLTGDKVHVSGQWKLGNDGKALLALFTPKDEEVFTTPVLFTPDGHLDSVVEIPVTDEPGAWTVRVHCWNENAKRDAVGWATIQVVHPDVALTSLTIEAPELIVRAGDPTTLTCTVANRSPLPANGVSVRFYRIARDRRFLIDEPMLTLRGGETRVVRVPWKAEPGFFRFEAQLWGRPDAIGRPSPDVRRKTVDRAIVGSRASSALELSPAPIVTEIVPFTPAASTSSPKAGERFERRATVLIGCVGEQPVADFSIALNDESSTPQVKSLAGVRPGEIYAETFSHVLDKPVLPREYHVVVSYFDKASSRAITLRHTDQVRAADFPDLAIVGDAITFLDEANKIAFGDSRPTDGHTVYIDVPVRNLGQSPVGPFAVEAFEGDPAAGGKPLRSLTNSSASNETAFLDPGQTRTIRFRWDPFHNAGQRQLYFRVDGDRRITELDESNNVVSRSLYVLSKGKLATGKLDPKIPSFELLQKGIYPLGATVFNEGETTVTKVLVEIYLGVKHTPEDKIGEVLVDRIGPTSKFEAMLDWKPTAEQLKRVPREKFSFIARLKGSTQRVIQLPE